MNEFITDIATIVWVGILYVALVVIGFPFDEVEWWVDKEND